MTDGLRTNLSDTGATSAVITASEFKTHARVYHTQDDTYIATLILVATQCIEHETRRALINRSFTLQLEGFPAGGEIILPRSPLSTVSSVTYTDSAGATQTLSASNYNTYSVNGVGRVVLKSTASWPTTQGTGALDVSVNFTAGYGATSASVPVALKQAVLLQATHLYDNRTPVAPAQLYEIPRSVERLIVQYHSGDYQ
ncbi:MAG: hypothetical protein RJB26_2512 [Pseudomonadota bacterium]